MQRHKIGCRHSLGNASKPLLAALLALAAALGTSPAAGQNLRERVRREASQQSAPRTLQPAADAAELRAAKFDQLFGPAKEQPVRQAVAVVETEPQRTPFGPAKPLSDAAIEPECQEHADCQPLVPDEAYDQAASAQPAVFLEDETAREPVRQVAFYRTTPQVKAAAGNAPAEVTLTWQVPEEINLGQVASCQLHVRNRGGSAASFVAVEVVLPEHAELKRTEPAAEDLEGTLHWLLGELPGGESRTLEIDLVPRASGQLAPAARVTFSQGAAAEILIRQPQLQLSIEGPQVSMVGQPCSFGLLVNNQGDGTAVDVLVNVRLEDPLAHTQGSDLEFRIGALGPGQSRRVDVSACGIAPGAARVMGAVTSGGEVLARSEAAVEIIRPELRLAIEGPKLRYVQRKATYQLTIENPGVAAADNVQLFHPLPEGMTFVQASSGGTYDGLEDRVTWFIGRLEPQQRMQVEVQLMPRTAGEICVEAGAQADAGAEALAETLTRVESISTLVLDVIDHDDPVEVSGETEIEVRLTNSGTEAACGVQVAANIPAEMELLQVTGPVDGRMEGSRVLFEPLAELEAGRTETFRFRVRCLTAGRARFQATFRTAEIEHPVHEEEVTQIYSDEPTAE
jgi:uncharacterized repeat protein (TIGR01451 family)